jgi:hypothetical protein
MATSTATLYPDSSTLANFKAWAQFISNALTSFGWTLAADSGQVNWSTIASVPSSSSWVYEVWTSADSLSACPITIKIEYGKNSSQGPNVWFTIGTGGTDGAGNLQSPHSTRTALPMYESVTDNATLLACYASGDAGSFRLAMFTNRDGYPDGYLQAYLMIMRSVDTAGVFNADYVTLLTWGQLGYTQQSVMAAGVGGVTNQESQWAGTLPVTSSSGSFNGNVAVTPIFPFVGYLGNPSIDVYLGRPADFVDGNVVVISPYGTAHSYRVVYNSNMPTKQPIPSTNCALLMRYE